MTAERFAPDREGSGSSDGAVRGADSVGVFQGGGLDPQVIVSVAARDICHSDEDVHCGLSLVSPGRAPETLAATDDLPVRVDWLQQEMGQGPGIGLPLGEVVMSKDLAADDRWLDFGKLCVAVMNVRSMVSIQILLPEAHRALLTWYSSEPTALDHLDVDAALRLSRLAAPAINSLVQEFSDTLFVSATDTCSRVAVAVGMAVARYRVAPSAAFELILEASNRLHRPLLDVACEVAGDGWLPETAENWNHRKRPTRAGSASGTGRASHPPSEFVGSEARDPRGRRGHDSTGDDRTLHLGGPELWHAPSSEARTPEAHRMTLGTWRFR